MKRSAVRELLKVTAQPEILSFAGGLPAPELFPVAETAAAAQVVLAREGARALQYAQTEGVAELRDWIAARFSTPARKLSRENVAITSGAQQALDLAGRVLLDPGDTVLVENPTYLSLLSAWRPLGAKFAAAPCDAGGLRPDALAPLLQRGPKLLYTMPNFQNPQGATLAAERRLPLVNLLREHGVALLEDDPYGELRFEGQTPPRLVDLDARSGPDGALDFNVIHAGTFSKILAPGLRLGWITASEEVVDQIVLAKQTADLHTSPFTQLIALELLASGFLDRQIPRLRRAYKERRDVMLQALAAHFPEGVTWTRPEGGMFLLATLPPGCDAGALLPLALERKVAFVPGVEFHLNGEGRNTMRLNFSHTPPERIEEGIRRLGALLKEQLAA